MTVRPRAGPRLSRNRQRGAMFFVALSLLAVLATALVISGSVAEISRVVAADAKTQEALDRAREALVAWAAAHPTHPGALPCPDTDDDGVANGPVAGACTSYIGRLPWRDLGNGDLRDSAGERLWYALSPNFRDAANQINSDTKGNRTVYSLSNTVPLTTQAAAVVFAPGVVLAGQSRDPSTTAACPTTGTTIARSLCADNYLESSGGVSNASTAGPYITAPHSQAFNDSVMILRTSDFIPIVERRVGADVRQVMLTYRMQSQAALLGGGCNCYPWADGDNNGTSDTGVNRGRVPLTASPHAWGTSLTDPVSGTVYTLPTLPPYFQTNNWQTVIYYAVGKQDLQNFGLAPTACTTCTVDPLLLNTLAINGTPGNAMILFTPGAAGALRPSTNWAMYLDDTENSNGDDRFITPTSKAFDRDRLYSIADPLPPASCAPNAKMLIAQAPCHTTGTNVKPVCQYAATALQSCTCSLQANTMITPPCRNTLNPGQCQSAVATLESCTL